MKTILLTNKYSGLPLEILKNAIDGRFRLLMLDEVTQEDLLKKAGEADYFLVSGRMKISREVLDQAGKLKMIQRTGVGLDNMDLAYAAEKGIPVYVNFGVNSDSVAEYSVMLMLAALKRSYFVNRHIRSGKWEKQKTGLTTHEIKGKKVGLVGMGQIGKKVAKKLSGFDVDIYYYDQIRLSAEEEECFGAKFLSFEDLLKTADIVSLHCGMSDENKHLISRPEFALMKQDSIIINTARGGLIDPDALAEALSEGKLLGAGIDVFESEPVDPDCKLLKNDEALFSPHIAGVSYEAFARMMNDGIANIVSFDRGDAASIEDLRIRIS